MTMNSKQTYSKTAAQRKAARRPLPDCSLLICNQSRDLYIRRKWLQLLCLCTVLKVHYCYMPCFLVSCTTIPTSPSTFTLCFTGFYYKNPPARAPPLSTPARLSPTFLWNARWTNRKWLPTSKEVLDLYLASEVMKILLA